MKENYQPSVLIYRSDNPYVFDMDNNGFPALTEKNVKRINFLIENDSNYRFDRIKKCIEERKYTTDEEKIHYIVKIIDIMNSTHQASLGRKKDDGEDDGRRETAKAIHAIMKDLDFYAELEKGNPDLVNKIAEKSIKGRYTFSFASKYCTYVSRYTFNCEKADNYSIYDKVMCEILPYYAWYYTGIYYSKSEVKNFGQKNKGNYKEYRNLIDSIRYANEKETGYHIRREDFDHLLWYYFKGDKDSKEDGYISRISKALDIVKREKKQNDALKKSGK